MPSYVNAGPPAFTATTNLPAIGVPLEELLDEEELLDDDELVDDDELEEELLDDVLPDDVLLDDALLLELELLDEEELELLPVEDWPPQADKKTQNNAARESLRLRRRFILILVDMQHPHRQIF